MGRQLTVRVVRNERLIILLDVDVFFIQARPYDPATI